MNFNNDVITPDICNNTIAFIMSETGAMGMHSSIEILTKDKRHLIYCFAKDDYFSVDEDLYKQLKMNFPIINDCKWNGAYKDVIYTSPNICLGGKLNMQTKIPEGWTEIAFDLGHHWICKNIYKDIFINYFKNKDPDEIILYGFDNILKDNIFDNMEGNTNGKRK